ncbi:hypothetical protein CsSME_00053358 [Camellia sinensis var. sinensis]
MVNSSSSSYSSFVLPLNINLLLSNFNSLITKNQVQNVVHATNFLGFVIGSISSLDPKILDSLGKFIPNPEFEN